MIKKILLLIFAAWIVLWAHFICRDLFMKGSIKADRALLSRSLEGKRSYVTGDRLYEFLSFAMRELPEGARYKIVGLEEGSIDKPHAAYYLYPHIEDEGASFILVYDKAGENIPGYETFSSLDGSRYILKKKEAK